MEIILLQPEEWNSQKRHKVYLSTYLDDPESLNAVVGKRIEIIHLEIHLLPW